MITSIKIPIQDLTLAFIEELKAKYGAESLEINIVPKQDKLSEKQFWEIIQQLDWNKSDSAAIVAPTIEKLATFSISQIYDFEDKLTDKLHQLDKKIIAEQVGYQKNKFFSVDTFLYARACVIANGEEAFKEVLTDPTTMPTDLTFEPLLSIASRAYQMKTGKVFNYLPSLSYETYVNQNGWN